jgi:hypothetical protein
MSLHATVSAEPVHPDWKTIESPLIEISFPEVDEKLVTILSARALPPVIMSTAAIKVLGNLRDNLMEVLPRQNQHVRSSPKVCLGSRSEDINAL